MGNTKEQILNEALSLFSIKGYDGVSMSDIAEKVGIKAASIYKHYSGKEDIFHTIIQKFEERTEHIFNPALLENTNYINISNEGLVKMIQQTFQIYAEEPFVSQCRKLFMISSFDRAEIGNLYTKYFIVMPMEYQAELFNMMQKAKVFAKKDAAIMAYQFYAPILVLLQQYDYKSITMEEAFINIELLVTQFEEVYKL